MNIVGTSSSAGTGISPMTSTKNGIIALQNSKSAERFSVRGLDFDTASHLYYGDEKIDTCLYEYYYSTGNINAIVVFSSPGLINLSTSNVTIPNFIKRVLISTPLPGNIIVGEYVHWLLGGSPIISTPYNGPVTFTDTQYKIELKKVGIDGGVATISSKVITINETVPHTGTANYLQRRLDMTSSGVETSEGDLLFFEVSFPAGITMKSTSNISFQQNYIIPGNVFISAKY